jgi:hypothetical protein
VFLGGTTPHLFLFFSLYRDRRIYRIQLALDVVTISYTGHIVVIVPEDSVVGPCREPCPVHELGHSMRACGQCMRAALDNSQAHTALDY